jgi:hypothetical protein
LGRALTEADDTADVAPVAILGYQALGVAIQQRRSHIGQRIMLKRVAVKSSRMPEGFRLPTDFTVDARSRRSCGVHFAWRDPNRGRP